MMLLYIQALQRIEKWLFQVSALEFDWEKKICKLKMELAKGIMS